MGKEARENQMKFQTLLQVLPDMVFIQKPIDGEVIDFYSQENKCLKTQDIIGQTHHDIFPDGIAKKLNHHLNKVFESQETQSIQFTLKLNKNNFEDFISISAPLGNNNIITVSREISEIRQVERDLRLAKNNAEKASEARSNFLRTISHEIRTPLNGIIGNTELLKVEAQTTEGASIIEAISYSSEHLLSVLNDVLDYSKIEADALSLDILTTNLHKSCVELVKNFQAKARVNNNVLTLNWDPQLSKYFALDDFRLNQIIQNLLNNTTKFTHEGSIELNVKSDSTQTPPSIRFEVKDSGIGMSAATQIQIFHPFSQAHSGIARKFGGTGLGISICDKLLKLMDSDIKVQSTIDIGSQFYFHLHLPEVDEIIEHENLEDTQEIQTGLKVLVAEDNKVNQKLISRILSTFGVLSEIAEDGLKVIEAYKEGDFDIIFMDIHMPNLDGLSAARIILDSDPHAIIWGLSADVIKETQDELVKIGMLGMIHKPFKPIDIKRVLSQL
tara:strand:+ start:921 stop:2420 length:1500 start_codon:yes stop_codon:yes gene_type:complete